MFSTIALLGPGTYRVLINSKVLWAGVLLQIFTGRVLSGRQWMGLICLVVACATEQVGSFNWNFGPRALGSVLIMGLCSAAAAVANQKLLQTRTQSVHD